MSNQQNDVVATAANLFTECPCEARSAELFCSSTGYQQCFTCGRTHSEGMDEEYLAQFPKLYQDMAAADETGKLFVPYFNQTDTQQMFLDGTSPEDAHWVLVPLVDFIMVNGRAGKKPDFERAVRAPFDQFFYIFNLFTNGESNQVDSADHGSEGTEGTGPAL